MAKKRTIAFITDATNITRGGEITFIYTLQYLSKEVYTPVVFLPSDGPMARRIDELGIEVRLFAYRPFITTTFFSGKPFYINHISHNNKTWDGFSYRVQSLKAQLIDIKADIVYTNSLFTLEGVFAAADLGIPHIFHMHSKLICDDFWCDFTGARFIASLLDKLSDYIIVTSNSCYKDIRDYIDNSKLIKIYPPLDYRLYQRPFIRPKEIDDNFKIIITSIGNISIIKAQNILIDALDILPAELKRECLVLLVGASDNDDFAKDILMKVKELSGSTNIKWLGFREDIPAILQSSDILVHTAVEEALGMVIIEAMACGKPVIATKSDGPEEIIKDDINGLLVPINDFERLSIRLQELIVDKGLRERLGELGKEYAGQFDVKIFAEKINDIIWKVSEKGTDYNSRREYIRCFEERIEAFNHEPDFENTISWKITEPLRRFGKLIRYRQ